MTDIRTNVKIEEWEPMTNEQAMLGAMFASMASRLKKRGSNFTPPKKKRKKKKR